MAMAGDDDGDCEMEIEYNVQYIRRQADVLEDIYQ